MSTDSFFQFFFSKYSLMYANRFDTDIKQSCLGPDLHLDRLQRLPKNNNGSYRVLSIVASLIQTRCSFHSLSQSNAGLQL